MPAIPMVLLRLWHHGFGGLQGEEGAGLPLGLQQERELESLAETRDVGALLPAQRLSGSALSPFPAGGCKEVSMCPEKASPSPPGGAQGSGRASGDEHPHLPGIPLAG